jgi:hypothetical protein
MLGMRNGMGKARLVLAAVASHLVFIVTWDSFR